MEVSGAAAFLDTNILVRHFTGQPADQAEHARRILSEAGNVLVTDVALNETAYVLGSQYGIARDLIVDWLVSLLRRDNISVYAIDKNIAIEGLLMCRPSGRVSFADAMVWAAARSAGAEAVYTFDRRFPSDGIDVRREL